MATKNVAASAAIALTVLAAGAADAAQLVKNGGFERGYFKNWVTDSTLPDGVVTNPLAPFAGSYYAQLGGASTKSRPYASLAQAITLALPGTDTLTYRVNLADTQAGDKFFARWDGKLIKGSLVKGKTGAADTWVKYTFTVTALGGGKDRLAFNFTSPTGPDPWALDQVSLLGARVPEPGTWTLMLVGIGGVGGLMRSRRGRSAAAA